MRRGLPRARVRLEHPRGWVACARALCQQPRLPGAVVVQGHIPYSLSYTPYPIFHILHPISNIPYPTFHIPHSLSHILYPISHIPHSITYILYPTSHIPDPTSHIPDPISHIPHPILHSSYPTFHIPHSVFPYPTPHSPHPMALPHPLTHSTPKTPPERFWPGMSRQSLHRCGHRGTKCSAEARARSWPRRAFRPVGAGAERGWGLCCRTVCSLIPPTPVTPPPVAHTLGTQAPPNLITPHSVMPLLRKPQAQAPQSPVTLHSQYPLFQVPCTPGFP